MRRACEATSLVGKGRAKDTVNVDGSRAPGAVSRWVGEWPGRDADKGRLSQGHTFSLEWV